MSYLLCNILQLIEYYVVTDYRIVAIFTTIFIQFELMTCRLEKVHSNFLPLFANIGSLTGL